MKSKWEHENLFLEKVAELIGKIEVEIEDEKNNALVIRDEEHRRNVRSIPGFTVFGVNGIFQIFDMDTLKPVLIHSFKSVRLTADNVKQAGKENRRKHLVIDIAALAFYNRPLNDEGELKFKNAGQTIYNANITDLLWIPKIEVPKMIKPAQKGDVELEILKFEEGFVDDRRYRCLVDLYPDFKVFEDQVVVGKAKKAIKQYELKSGYKSLNLGNETVRLHILIALAYLGKPLDSSYKYVVHLDGKKDANGQFTNNHYSNLKWWYDPEIMNNDDWTPYHLDPEYKINNETGKVISIKSGKVYELKEQISSDGYKSLDIDGKKVRRNRLVAKTFHPEQESSRKNQVHHKDNNRGNDSPMNVEFVTVGENNSAKPPSKTAPKTKPVLHIDENTGQILREFKSVKEAIEKLNLKYSDRTVRNWAQSQKKEKGFIWTYKEYEPKDGEEGIRITGKFDEYILHYPDHVLYNSGVVVNTKNGHIMTINRSQSYPKVTLTYNGLTKKFSIHRLLALFFVPGRTKEKWMVNHKNGNKNDFRLENLEWVTPSENSVHGIGKAVIKIDPKTGLVVKKFASLTAAARSMEKDSKAGWNIAQVCEGARNTAYEYDWEWDE